MRWTKLPLVLATLIIVPTGSLASKLTYLSCDLPSHENAPAAHFDFVLDEPNSTVSYFVKEVNATNKETAVFGPETVTWTNNSPYWSMTKTINRVDLSFTEDFNLTGKTEHYVGTCSLTKKPPATKF